MLIGGARAPRGLGGPGFALPEAIRLEGLAVRPVGADWMMEADIAPPGGTR
jgi:hypothetical protein